VPITRSHDSLTVVMLMVAWVALSVLGLIEFLFRPTYAKRVLAFAAMSRSQRAPDYVSNLSSRPLNQVEADPNGSFPLSYYQQGAGAIRGRFSG
jgi:hypothetical protein